MSEASRGPRQRSTLIAEFIYKAAVPEGNTVAAPICRWQPGSEVPTQQCQTTLSGRAAIQNQEA